MAIPVVLSGGIGSRLWPLSRQDLPKQFLPLIEEQSLFQITISRAAKILAPLDKLIVVSNEEHKFMVQEQGEKTLNFELDLLLEPCGKNTAPAIAIAALHTLSNYGDEPLWIMPADHLLDSGIELKKSIAAAEVAATAGNIVCFGITPTKPATGFGYIKTTIIDSQETQNILEFVEKPQEKEAKQMLKDGSYLWNSGMFMAKPSVILNELKTYQEKLYERITTFNPTNRTERHTTNIPVKVYENIESISIDYAVMEQTKLGKVVKCDASWNDIGSWSSLMDSFPKDQDGNVTNGKVITHDVTDSMIHASKRAVAGLGLKDTIVVETADAVLVADKSKSEDVKHIVANLVQSGQDVATKNLKCNRPWGSYETLILGDRFRVKHIYVNPGASLSLQKHMHRAEHWVIVAGTAQVQRDDETTVLTENKSTYIPIGTVHRLTNIGKIPLELIEVQTGSYLEEDDIIRLDDVYGREVENL